MKTEVLWWRSYSSVEEIEGLLEEVNVMLWLLHIEYDDLPHYQYQH